MEETIEMEKRRGVTVALPRPRIARINCPATLNVHCLGARVRKGKWKKRGARETEESRGGVSGITDKAAGSRGRVRSWAQHVATMSSIVETKIRGTIARPFNRLILPLPFPFLLPLRSGKMLRDRDFFVLDLFMCVLECWSKVMGSSLREREREDVLSGGCDKGNDRGKFVLFVLVRDRLI